jgi:hypothetical protein
VIWTLHASRCSGPVESDLGSPDPSFALARERSFLRGHVTDDSAAYLLALGSKPKAVEPVSHTGPGDAKGTKDAALWK